MVVGDAGWTCFTSARHVKHLDPDLDNLYNRAQVQHGFGVLVNEDLKDAEIIHLQCRKPNPTKLTAKSIQITCIATR